VADLGALPAAVAVDSLTGIRDLPLEFLVSPDLDAHD
jgi:hypothetical protein